MHKNGDELDFNGIKLNYKLAITMKLPGCLVLAGFSYWH